MLNPSFRGTGTFEPIARPRRACTPRGRKHAAEWTVRSPGARERQARRQGNAGSRAGGVAARLPAARRKDLRARALEAPLQLLALLVEAVQLVAHVLDALIHVQEALAVRALLGAHLFLGHAFSPCL